MLMLCIEPMVTITDIIRVHVIHIRIQYPYPRPGNPHVIPSPQRLCHPQLVGKRSGGHKIKEAGMNSCILVNIHKMNILLRMFGTQTYLHPDLTYFIPVTGISRHNILLVIEIIFSV
ncbi:hypothetical protein SDC9_157519 [bioreactor metagenome]|uniref:Uncharacterized protein n=1 Tax=bioreactor metagenome TaxID=1076179 RepID=A0A645FCD2_9ZZZZ